jgi:hypothetical protein
MSSIDKIMLDTATSVTAVSDRYKAHIREGMIEAHSKGELDTLPIWIAHFTEKSDAGLYGFNDLEETIFALGVKTIIEMHADILRDTQEGPDEDED